MRLTDEQLKSAICKNDIEFLERNIGKYKIDHRFKDEDNDTLLLYSISYPDSNAYSFFLKQNANLSLVNDQKENVLHGAVYSGKLSRVEKVINEENIDKKSIDGASPLLLAISLDKNDLAKYLIESGADVNTSDEGGITPLHIASQQNGDEEFLKFLLKSGANPLLKTKKGNLPLALAVNFGNKRLIETLFKATYDDSTISNN